VGTEKRERQKAGRQARLDQAKVAQARRQRFKLVRNLLIVGAAVIGLLFVLAQDDDEDVTATATSTTAPTETTSTTAPLPAGASITGETSCPAADGSSERTTTFEQPPPLCIDPAKTYTAVWETSEGTVRVELDIATTPATTNNFVVLSRYHFYDGTVLFRTDGSIGIIQGGSPHTQDNGDPGPGYDLADEGFDYEALAIDPTTGQPSGGPYSYVPGDLVMARTAQPDGAGAQFFFCVTEACAGLDGQGVYVRFGAVTEGLDVLQAILELDTGGSPSRAVTVGSITIEEA
jgi:cyclophilin family peptidyl-prolyl cis-trans isomerase